MAIELEVDQFLSDESTETVTFRTDAGGAVSVTAIADLDEPIRDTEGYSPTIYTGRLIVATTDKIKLLRQPEPVLKVEVDGYTWRVVDIGNDKSGVCEVAIQRESREHSNAVDLQGNQHRYGD